jgi:hypothetical protein
MAKTRRRFSRSKNMMKRGFRKGFHTSKKGFKKGFKVVTASSRKYMPRVKTGLENVGSNVTKSATKSVPILQKASRDLLGVFGLKKSTKTKV